MAQLFIIDVNAMVQRGEAGKPEALAKCDAALSEATLFLKYKTTSAQEAQAQQLIGEVHALFVEILSTRHEGRKLANEIGRAIDAFKKALRIDPQLPGARDQLEKLQSVRKRIPTEGKTEHPGK